MIIKVDIFSILGNCLFKLERYEESIAMYNKVIELDPLCYMVYYNKGLNYFYEIGKCLEELNRYEEAIEMMDKVIELEP